MKKAIFALLLTFAFAIGTQALAQGCSVCTKTASELDPKSARGLNGGIVYLATLPLLAIASVGLIWWRKNRGLEQ